MKKYLNHVLVVEGKEDASYLSNYIGSEIVVVNGYELSNTTISYLKNKRVIVLTDPDEAGKRIRQKLNSLLDDVINVEIDISKCSKGIKNGVAECEIDEVLTKLAPYFIKKEDNNASISNIDLFNLGISKDKDLRAYICKELNLGNCNNKQLLKRLLNNKIELVTIKKLVEKYNNGN